MAAQHSGLFVAKVAEDVKKNVSLHSRGDHLTYLSVYKAWKEEISHGQNYADEYCTNNGLNADVLYNADDLLRKVTKACGNASPPIPLQEGFNEENIMRALIHSFIDNIATANDPHKTNANFTLTKNFTTNPVVDAKIDRNSSIPSKELTTVVMDTVIYALHRRTTKGDKSSDSLSGITLLPSGLCLKTNLLMYYPKIS